MLGKTMPTETLRGRSDWTIQASSERRQQQGKKQKAETLLPSHCGSRLHEYADVSVLSGWGGGDRGGGERD